MAGYLKALDYVAKLEAAGVAATADPRAATPPCVLIGMTANAYANYCGAEVDFYAAVLVPGPWNADGWKRLDEIEPTVAEVLPVTRSAFVLYRLALDAPPIPAFLFTWTESVDL